ncbi:LysR family transcriptional regulator [Cronobacter turicensis]
MEYRHLVSFVTLAEELHFGNAARKLNIAQPALSQYIKALESELRIALFTRSKRDVRLTYAGEQFLEDARAIVKFHQNIKEKSCSLRTGACGLLRLSYVGSSIVDPVLSHLIKTYREIHPGVDFIIEENNVSEQLSLLDNNLVDLALVRLPVPSYSQLHSFTISSRPLIAVLPDNHPMAAESCISLSALSNEKFLIQQDPPGIGLGWSALNACVDQGFTPKNIQYTRDVATAIALVSMGIGVALVPETQHSVMIPHVTYCNLSNEKAMTKLSLLWSVPVKNKLTDNFIDFVRAFIT